MAKLRVSRVEEADRSKFCDLARAAHEESLFADIAFSKVKFFKLFDNTLEMPDLYLGLKVSIGEEIVGFCYAVIGDYYIGEGIKVVTVVAIVTAPKIRSHILGGKAALRLTRGIEIWAEGLGAYYILYHVTSGINPTSADSTFRKLGMTTLGGNYGVRLKNESKASS